MELHERIPTQEQIKKQNVSLCMLQGQCKNNGSKFLSRIEIQRPEQYTISKGLIVNGKILIFNREHVDQIEHRIEIEIKVVILIQDNN